MRWDLRVIAVLVRWGSRTLPLLARGGSRTLPLLALGLLAIGVTPPNAEILRAGQPAPEIAGGPWINSAALTLEGLRGRVVLVEFWTYG
jgi:hypothetical protein